MPLPDSLDGHGCREETISHAEDGKDDDEDHDQRETSLHGRWEAIQDAPAIAAVAASGHAWIIAADGRAVQYQPEESR